MNNHTKVFGPFSEIVTYKKNAVILEDSNIEDYIYFVIKGCIIQTIIIDGDEICKTFSYQNMYSSSYTSFLTRKPSHYKSISVTDTVVERIHYNYIQEAYKHSFEHQKIGRLFAEKLFIDLSERNLLLITKSAKERYLDLIKSHPEILKHLPLKHIASYLGITAVSLSRIRKQLTL